MKVRNERMKARSRERAKARKIVHDHVGTEVFLAAQNWTCPICSRRLNETDLLSIDHVYSFAKTKRHTGNLLIAHQVCNYDKDDRHPTRDEQEMLGLVNRCLQYHKGFYRAVLPPKIRGWVVHHVPKVFIIHEKTPSEFFFSLLTEIVISVMIRFNERFRREPL